MITLTRFGVEAPEIVATTSLTFVGTKMRDVGWIYNGTAMEMCGAPAASVRISAAT